MKWKLCQVVLCKTCRLRILIVETWKNLCLGSSFCRPHLCMQDTGIRLGIWKTSPSVSCNSLFYKYKYLALTFKVILYEIVLNFCTPVISRVKILKWRLWSLKYLKVQKNFTCHLVGHKKQTQLQNQIKVEIHLGLLYRIYELSKKKARIANLKKKIGVYNVVKWFKLMFKRNIGEMHKLENWSHSFM